MIATALLVLQAAAGTDAVPAAADTVPRISLGEAIRRSAQLDPDYVEALGDIQNAEWGRRAAVIAFFVQHPRLENVWRGRVTPIIAFFLLSIILFATVVGLGDVLGLAPDSIFNWAFAAGYAVLAVLGAGWAAIIRFTKPDVYAVIGRGVERRTVFEFPEPPRPHSHAMAFQNHLTDDHQLR